MDLTNYDVRRELLRHGPFVVYRAVRRHDERPVLIEAVSPRLASAADRLSIEREFELLRGTSIQGLPRAYELIRDGEAPRLVLEDRGLTPLAALLRGGPLPLRTALTIASQICSVLRELHGRLVTHASIAPGSLLVSPAVGDVELLNVGRTPGPQDIADRQAPGAAAYISPEQTGRMNRGVDYRTDFYSLGVTLYEMLAGAPPFSSADPLEVVHAHVARTPAPLTRATPPVPEQVWRIIDKLLAKSAEERYQSALGLKADLDTCVRELETSGSVALFDIGRRDIPERLVIPPRLYGRDGEVAELRRAFEHVSRGQAALMLVSGYSGIGKTSLIRELYRPGVRRRGHFVSGKSDQIVRDIPYGAFAQAFRNLVWQMLTESDEQLSAWRGRLSEALGANGGVLAEVIPDIALVTGALPAVPPLEPMEARNRFAYVFQRFVGAVARPDQPLVVFLDDLQWVDAATLDLLHDLLTSPGIGPLLIVGAYRDNEVDDQHLLTWAVSRLEAAGASVSRLSLGPLGQDDLAAFLSDILYRERHDVAPLAGLIQQKTDGNPFFVIQFLRTLEHERLLVFDPVRREWMFDLKAIAGAGITDNVIDLMTRKIRRLSPPAQQVLTLAACLGSRFDVETLRTIGRLTPAEAAAGLDEAVTAGLLQPVNHRAGLPVDPAQGPAAYEFLHDRVQQAAYGLIPEDQKTSVHLDAGRLLLGGMDVDAPDDRIFTVINHLNTGRGLIDDDGERVRLARLNLRAGRKAKGSAAYRAALEYFRIGAAIAEQVPADYRPEDDLPAGRDLRFSLGVESAECQYLAGEFDPAEAALRDVLGRAGSALERAQASSLLIRLYEHRSRWVEAIAVGREALRGLGLALSADADGMQAALEREIEAVQRHLAGRPIASLVDLPEMTAPDVSMALRLLTLLWAPAYLSGNVDLVRLISATIVRLSLEHGHTEDSAYGYVTHAITVGPVRKDYRAAYEWGRLALEVNQRFNDAKRRAKIHQQFQAHVNVWCRPLQTCIPHAREAWRSGLETGDFTYAGYGAATEAWPAFLTSRDLEAFVRDYTPTLELLQKVNMPEFADAHRVMLNWALALQGRTSDGLSLTHGSFDERRFIEAHRTNDFFLMLIFAAKLHLAVVLDAVPDALAAARQARSVAVTGTIWPVLIEFWGALAAGAAFDDAPAAERPRLAEDLAGAEQSLAELAEVCPGNFRAPALLVASERRRSEGRLAEAGALAEEAVAWARQTMNLPLEALALERRGRVAFQLADVARGRQWLDEACRCYAAWGATAKVRQLRARAGEAVAGQAEPVPASGAWVAAAPASPLSLDMATVLKVAQAIAVELEFDGLLRKLMTLALENAGARRGVFLEEREGALYVGAEADAERDGVTLGRGLPIEEADGVSASVARYVHRTGREVVIADARGEERFAADPYIGRTQAKSILCVPVAHHGRLRGILYLENNLTPDAFTPDRLEMMRVLAAQTAISLENARLYEHMRREVERRTTAEHALRDALSEVEALKNRLEAENVYLQEEIRTQHNFNEIVGNSPALLDALRKVERVAPTESTVLILGETGTGKELFARAVHSRSGRRQRPLVKVNCGGIPPGLVESELFGHVKGAFTGAIEKRVGRFELADGGTIFLDEIGELPLEAQVKLLRVLQEQEFEPVGSSRSVRVSVRVIAATNRNLDRAVRDGTFRADLLYRLNVFPIEVPPLRERRADIGLLVAFFAGGLSRRLGKPVHGFSSTAMPRLAAYAWPGNVRELQNVVERAAILATGPVLDLEETLVGDAGPGSSWPERDGAPAGPGGQSLQDVERLHILDVLRRTGGVVEGTRGAAAILGLHPNTLRSRMKKLGITIAARSFSSGPPANARLPTK